MPIGGAPLIQGIYKDYVCVRDKKAQNTDGGTFTSGAWRTRDINEELADTANICSIASNQITLAAGTYRCLISCPALAVGRHQTRLYDITNSATLLTGSSEWSNQNYGDQTRSVLVGRFTLAAQTVLEIQQRSEYSANLVGFGVACGFTDEIYTIAEFWREAS